MVLDLSPPTEPYDTPLSTPDPYSSTPTTSQTIEPSSLLPELSSPTIPHPLPILSPLFGLTPLYTATIASHRLSLLHSLLARPATSEERAAILYHEAKAIRYISYLFPTSLILGLNSAWNTRASYRFPFYGSLLSPKNEGWWDGERVRLAGKTVVRGEAARALVHGIRGSAYGGLAYLVGGMVAGSFATTVANVGELTDPRLSEFQEAIKVSRGRKDGLEKVKVGGVGPGQWRDGVRQGQGQGQGRDVTGQGEKSAVELWTRHRRGIGADDVDDASPSAGTEEGFMTGSEDFVGPGTDTGALDDAQMRSQTRKYPRENRTPMPRNDQIPQQPNNDSFSDSFGGSDDASPTASSGNQAGSAWDRIRQRAHSSSSSSPQPTSSPSTSPQSPSWNAVQRDPQSTSPQSPTPTSRSWNEVQQGRRQEDGGWATIKQGNEGRGSSAWENRRRGATASDNFTFSAKDEERQLAKEEAQEAFDRRVERERGGGEF